MFFEYVGYLFLVGAILVTVIADIIVSKNNKKYGKVEIKKDMTGSDIARKILKEKGLDSIYVVESTDILTNHYDSSRKVIRLTKKVYRENTIAAISMAAHECAHAIQDKENYIPLKIRSFLQPFIVFAIKFGYAITLLGLLFQIFHLAWTGIAMLVILLLLQLFLLPIETDARDIAYELIRDQDFLTKEERDFTYAMLRSISMSYVALLLTTPKEAIKKICMILLNDEE